MEKKIQSILMLAIFLTSTISIASNNTAVAHTESDPYTTDLLAGQTIDVGDVLVWNDVDYLYVKYLITELGWCLLETQLQVATSLEGIPQKNGNPIPGKFTYKATHECVTEYTYMIELSWDAGQELFIAAHAKVQELITAAPYAASTVISSTQGTRKDGTPVLPERSNPTNAFVKDYSGGAVTFYSLGFGGEIIVSFDCPIRNGEGNDVSVWEVTNGAYPPERADVFGSQDGTNYVLLGTATNGRTAPSSGGNSLTESAFDLNSLTWVSYIKIVDVSDLTLFGADADAFDLDGIYSLQNCINTETAWGDGIDFPGKNWATYFEYTVQDTEWNLEGEWVLRFIYPQGGSNYDHDMTVTVQADGTFEGTGGYPAGGSHSHTWEIEGTVVGDEVEFHIVYLTGNPGYELQAEGIIASDGTMSGTWTATGQPGPYNWMSLDGLAN
ncbi:hypothetical protein [[Eubacterium] cellulosolvens]